MKALALFALAALCEIAGCYAVWMWLRLGRSPWLLVPGLVALILFALILARTEASFAGRAYAAYGGVYVGGALLWLLFVEHVVPDKWDVLGALLCVIGALVILFGPR